MWMESDWKHDVYNEAYPDWWELVWYGKIEWESDIDEVKHILSENESDVFRILWAISEYISDIQNLEYKTKQSLLETKWVWKSEKYPSSIQLNNE